MFLDQKISGALYSVAVFDDDFSSVSISLMTVAAFVSFFTTRL